MTRVQLRIRHAECSLRPGLKISDPDDLAHQDSVSSSSVAKEADRPASSSNLGCYRSLARYRFQVDVGLSTDPVKKIKISFNCAQGPAAPPLLHLVVTCP